MLSPFPFSELRAWYMENGRHDLPWRDYSFDAKTLGYRVWLSETMLQQTQVGRVASYFENILEAFPTVEDLAKSSYEDFFPYYKGLGYYSRARNMLAAAKQVVDDFDGVFPEDTESLRTLKGVGPYTAEAIRAFAYNEPTLSFDTNLEKIFSRYYHGNKFQKLSKEEKSQIIADFEKYYLSQSQPSIQLSTLKGHRGPQGRKSESHSVARDINNALMDYGATVSLNSISNINWDKYPLPSSQFYQTRGELEPVKQKKISSFPNKEAYVVAILHENHKVYFSETPSVVNDISLAEGDYSTASFVEGGGRRSEGVGKTESPSSREMSEGQREFSPFLIGKNTGNPRAMIQEYFIQNHGLELSVRPPELKSYNSQEVPYLVCYCQIQSGTHDFQSFPGLKVRGFEEGYVEELKFGENLSLF